MNRRKFLCNGTTFMLGMPGMMSPFFSASHSLTGSVPVGIIGVGIRGRQLMNVIIDRVSDLKIVAVCDIRDDHLKGALALAGTNAIGYSDYRQLLDNKNISAVFIATPLHLHFSMVMEAIAAGKHVYCEKMMAHTIDQTLTMRQVVSRSSLVFQVGYQERESPLFRQIERLIRNGACGHITYVDCCWNRNGDWRQPVRDSRLEKLINWRMYREFSGGLMAELCSHQIDLVNWLTQKHPTKVLGMGGIDYWKDGRETFDNVTALFEYEGGIKARFTALTANAYEGFRMKFYGSKATIEINRNVGQRGFIFPEQHPDEHLLNIDAITRPSPPWASRDQGIPIIVDGPNDLAYSTMQAIVAFAKSIRDKTTPASNANTAAITSIAVHMANDAMSTGKTVYWDATYNAT